MAVDLEGFSRRMLDEAIRLYLKEAYGDAPPTQSVQKRLALPDGATLAELAAADVFERTPADAPPAACTRIRLRLGTCGYPHMKLGLDRVPGSDDWVLVVDGHDSMLLAVAQDAERDAVQAIVKQNADVKTRIEKRFARQGRAHRAARPAAAGPPAP